MTSWPFGELPMFGFDLVMADPPWHFELHSAKGEEKSPQAQYRTMSLDQVKALPVGHLVGAGGALFLWCTWPLVAIGAHVDVMRAWGFVPATGGVWAKRTRAGKLRWGTGYVLRSLCEPFIIGRQPGAPLNGRGAENFIETIDDAALDGLAREHSRKPEEVYDLVERIWPTARRADLFARQVRPGWSGWGDELDKFAA